MTYSLTLRQDLNRKLTVEELDNNFLYLENRSGGSVSIGATGPQGATGAQGSTGPQGATGPAGSVSGSTYSLIIYSLNSNLIESQIFPNFVTQSFTQSFLNYSMPFPVFTGGTTFSIILDGVYKTASALSDDGRGNTVSLDSIALSGVATIQQSMGPGIFLDSVSDVNYSYRVQEFSNFYSSESTSLNSSGFQTYYLYNKQTNEIGDQHQHLLTQRTYFEDYQISVEVVVPLDASASVTSTYSISNTIGQVGF